jgi:hypothetical protein
MSIKQEINDCIDENWNNYFLILKIELDKKLNGLKSHSKEYVEAEIYINQIISYVKESKPRPDIINNRICRWESKIDNNIIIYLNSVISYEQQQKLYKVIEEEYQIWYKNNYDTIKLHPYGLFEGIKQAICDTKSTIDIYKMLLKAGISCSIRKI